MSARVSLQIFLGFLMFAAVFVPLERRFPRRAYATFRSGWNTDVVYYVAGCFVAKLSDATSLGAMLLVRNATSLSFQSDVAMQPSWLQFLEILTPADFVAYVFHRCLHQYAGLWRLHRVHHSSQRMDWLANVRLPPLDKMLGDCLQFIPIFCIGFADGPVLAYTIALGFQGYLAPPRRRPLGN
jgi:sterol desaturase/sphingolipid hydroxylase (fatty acid hydroxylase superfamily)